MIVYGIKTCDTVKKAIKALEAAGHPVSFRDIRAEPLTAAEIAEFSKAFGEKLINRASTTWRGLSEDERAAAPEALIAAHPALMKRPVIRGAVLTIGWDKAAQAAHL
ncbi:MAG: arsenate reductase [Sphingomonadales bacterium]|nr:arsenate reductase [Sphingomonadales bacterium]